MSEKQIRSQTLQMLCCRLFNRALVVLGSLSLRFTLIFYIPSRAHQILVPVRTSVLVRVLHLNDTTGILHGTAVVVCQLYGPVVVAVYL